MSEHLVNVAGYALVSALLYTGFTVRFPPPLLLDQETVRLLRRHLLPVHALGLGLSLIAGFGIGWVIYQLGQTDAVRELAAVACGLAGMMLVADLWFLALLRFKGTAWWQGYRAFLSQQHGFDYFSAYRVVHTLVSVAVVGLLLAVWLS